MLPITAVIGPTTSRGSSSRLAKEAPSGSIKRHFCCTARGGRNAHPFLSRGVRLRGGSLKHASTAVGCAVDSFSTGRDPPYWHKSRACRAHTPVQVVQRAKEHSNGPHFTCDCTRGCGRVCRACDGTRCRQFRSSTLDPAHPGCAWGGLSQGNRREAQD